MESKDGETCSPVIPLGWKKGSTEGREKWRGGAERFGERCLQIRGRVETEAGKKRGDENEGVRGSGAGRKADGKREDGQSRKEALGRERERRRIVKVIN